MVAPRSTLLLTCALACVVAACSSSAATDSPPPGQPPPDADAGAGSDSSSAEDGGGGTDSTAPTDAAGTQDAPPPAAPACKTGDRKEFAGPIPNTAIAVAVCSLCGESYVVASNGGASADELSVANGSKTITATVPAHGTATTANLADNPADGTVTVCSTSGSRDCLPKAPANERYCNPYRDVGILRRERIDQGVDYGGSGPIYALGPGTIDLYRNRNDTGWPGGTFLSYKVTAGPASGKTIYLAENIDLDPSLKTGSFVYSGTVLGTLVNASPDSESGWGVPGAGYTAEHACYVEGCDTPLGDNFNQLLVCLKAPSGVAGTGGCCPQPTGYPTDWCADLAKWQ